MSPRNYFGDDEVIDAVTPLRQLGDLAGRYASYQSQNQAYNNFDRWLREEGESPEVIQRINSSSYGPSYLQNYRLSQLSQSPVEGELSFDKRLRTIDYRIGQLYQLGTPQALALAKSYEERRKALVKDYDRYTVAAEAFEKSRIQPVIEGGKNAPLLNQLAELVTQVDKEQQSRDVASFARRVWRTLGSPSGTSLLAYSDLERLLGAQAFQALDFKSKAGSNVSQREFETIIKQWINPRNSWRSNFNLLAAPLITANVQQAFAEARARVNPEDYPNLSAFRDAWIKEGWKILSQNRAFRKNVRIVESLGIPVRPLISSAGVGAIPTDDSAVEGGAEERSSSPDTPTGGSSSSIAALVREMENLSDEDKRAIIAAGPNPSSSYLDNALGGLSSVGYRAMKGWLEALPFNIIWNAARNLGSSYGRIVAPAIAREFEADTGASPQEVEATGRSEAFKRGARETAQAIRKWGDPFTYGDALARGVGVDPQGGERLGDIAQNLGIFGNLGSGGAGTRFLKAVGASTLSQGLNDSLSSLAENMGISPTVTSLLSNLAAAGVAQGVPSFLERVPLKPRATLKDIPREELLRKEYLGGRRGWNRLGSEVMEDIRSGLRGAKEGIKGHRRFVEDPEAFGREKTRLYDRAREVLPAEVPSSTLRKTLESQIENIRKEASPLLLDEGERQLIRDLEALKPLKGETPTPQQINRLAETNRASKIYDPQLNRAQQKYAYNKAEAFEKVGERALASESPAYREAIEEATDFYRTTTRGTAANRIINHISSATTPQSLRTRLNEVLTDEATQKALREGMSAESYRNVVKIAKEGEDLLERVSLVKNLGGGGSPYRGAHLEVPKIAVEYITKGWKTMFGKARSYRSLNNPKWVVEWRKLFKGIRNNSAREIREGERGLRELGNLTAEEDRILKPLYEVFENYKEGVSLNTWNGFLKVVGASLRKAKKDTSGSPRLVEELEELEKRAKKEKEKATKR